MINKTFDCFLIRNNKKVLVLYFIVFSDFLFEMLMVFSHCAIGMIYFKMTIPILNEFEIAGFIKHFKTKEAQICFHYFRNVFHDDYVPQQVE